MENLLNELIIKELKKEGIRKCTVDATLNYILNLARSGRAITLDNKTVIPMDTVVDVVFDKEEVPYTYIDGDNLVIEFIDPKEALKRVQEKKKAAEKEDIEDLIKDLFRGI